MQKFKGNIRIKVIIKIFEYRYKLTFILVRVITFTLLNRNKKKQHVLLHNFNNNKLFSANT